MPDEPRDIVDRTFEFAADIALFCRSQESRSGTLNALLRQLIRSGTSIGANVEEAQAGQSRADFVAKYSIALKEARETRYWLRLLRKIGIQDDRLNVLLPESDEIARILGAIIVSTKRNTP